MSRCQSHRLVLSTTLRTELAVGTLASSEPKTTAAVCSQRVSNFVCHKIKFAASNGIPQSKVANQNNNILEEILTISTNIDVLYHIQAGGLQSVFAWGGH